MLGWVTEAKRGHKALGRHGRGAKSLGAMIAAIIVLQPASGALAQVEQNSWYRAGRATIERMHGGRPLANRAKNVILFVGDGMSITTVTAARILEGQLAGSTGEENLLSFEHFEHVALSKTYNTNQQVPDSAGTMTAMVSGIKTKAGVLGVDERVVRGDHSQVASGRVPSLFELAEARGLATGIVTTTRITHATPAACYGHSPERDWENDGKLSPTARADGFRDLALQLIEFRGGSTSRAGDGLEVALGGGRANFLPNSGAPEFSDPTSPTMGSGIREDGRNLIAEWQGREGAAYVSNARQLVAVKASKTKHLLGLFHPSHMNFEADRDTGPAGEPSLAQMTAKAIEILAREEKGFVLMVEGGRIDHGHHLNNAYRALTDTIAFSDAVRTALEMTTSEETLIVATADHSHTMTMSGYPYRGNDILGLVRGSDKQGALAKELTRDQLGEPYTSLSYANGPGYTRNCELQPEGSKQFPHAPEKMEGIQKCRPSLRDVATHEKDYLQDATVALSRETHGGEDVAIYARGPSAWLFSGVVEQNYIFHALTEALGWNAPSGSGSGASHPERPDGSASGSAATSPNDGRSK
jgi:alkaline phosphatase